MRFRPGRALILIATAIVLGFAARSDGPAMFVSRFVWTMDEAEFGAWSGLDLSPDGTGFAAITDKGLFIEGRLRRGPLGGLRGVDPGALRALGNSADDIFGPDTHDAEGLALAPDGRVLVAFEAIRRVLSYPDAQVTGPTVLPIHLHFIQLNQNRGLEALAIGPDGALYTLPEFMLGGGPFPVFRFDGTDWALFGQIPDRGDGFAPVGADVGPDGRFYLLERKFLRNIGFESRVRRYRIEADGLADETLLLSTRAGTHDNLEGLGVWRDAFGRLRLTMISDDNFEPLQATELVEYVLPRRLD